MCCCSYYKVAALLDNVKLTEQLLTAEKMPWQISNLGTATTVHRMLCMSDLIRN